MRLQLLHVTNAFLGGSLLSLLLRVQTALRAWPTWTRMHQQHAQSVRWERTRQQAVSLAAAANLERQTLMVHQPLHANSARWVATLKMPRLLVPRARLDLLTTTLIHPLHAKHALRARVP